MTWSRQKGEVLLALLGTELLMLARDKRTVLVSIILPVFVMPLAIASSSYTAQQRQERQESQTYDYAIAGVEAELARGILAESASTDSTASDESRLSLRELSEVDPGRAALESQEIHVLVEVMAAHEREPSVPRPGKIRDNPPAVPLFRLVYLADWEASQTAAGALQERLMVAREQSRSERLSSVGFPVTVEQVAAISARHDVASAGERTGSAFGRKAPILLLMLLLVGGSVVAADTLAGEKERGTLETLLTSAATRGEIVVSKLLAIMVVGLCIAGVQLVSLVLYLGLDIFELPPDFVLELSPAAVFWLLMLLVPVATLVAAALLWVSGRSATYKAFQTNFIPVLLVFLLPAAAPLMPGLSLRSVVVAMPVANVAIGLREVLSGRLDVLMLSLTWVFASAAAWLVTRAVLRDLDSERLVSGVEVDDGNLVGGPSLFRRHVLPWFGAMWAVIFLATTNLAMLSNLRGQALFNLVAVFLGGSLLMIRIYRLDVKETLSLRGVSPTVWLAVVLGAPATFLVTVAVARFSSWLFPLPKEILEAFSQGVLPDTFSAWELLLWIAILPGICEEIAFRGLLLQGLRKRFHPIALCLVVGAVFALFHMQWVRLLPTFFLGTLLSALTLLSGSILTAMLWHILNNAAALGSAQAGFDLMALDPWIYAVAAVVAVLSWTLIWRRRCSEGRGAPTQGSVF